ncbi:dTDP-4-dehydrorhamnose reductase [Intrasporangium calvum]|uniref:dTDP-4-dehydrorhamnose reductase n=1 Tax=Intrasporangium calvum TaxID=53358 RepID=A0ABT5GHH2_9MICO|nr:dTDP-4-dehydrorhamnose reductase [Intrasporangium calvum]MDC5697701.1 dTDP-4-dehydrorhamnose reductase [Intrasporangium calvum]
MSSGLRVLVAGASGMLGVDVVAALRAAGHVVTAMGRADLDVTDPAECIAAAAGHDLIVNCAAFTRVDDAETEEAQAFRVNAVGAANLARGAAHAGARLVQISTDYVFDGTATEPYAAEHPPAPRSAYGRTKLAGEWAVRALCADSWIVRTAWLYGAGGGNFVTTMLRLAGEQETLDVVNDQWGQPTWTRDLADLIVRMVDADAPAGVYHGTSSGETTWHGLAQAVFVERGLDPERVRPTTTAAFPRPAPRPARSVLSHQSLEDAGVAPIRDWRAALAEQLQC